MDKKYIIFALIAVIVIVCTCNAVSAVDATVKNDDMEINCVDSDDDWKNINEIKSDNIYIDYYAIDKYGNDVEEEEDNEIEIHLNNDDMGKLKQGGTVEKVSECKVYKKIKKTKSKTVYVNKKTLKGIKKGLKKGSYKFTIYDESKYAKKPFKLFRKISNTYDGSLKNMVKIKVKGKTYKYALFQKCYGDDRDYKWVKFYKVKVYYSHYVFRPVKKVLKTRISYSGNKYHVKVLQGNKLCKGSILKGYYVFK